jgi:hypothetical protein
MSKAGPQSSAPALSVTPPRPVPALLTVSLGMEKVAEIDLDALMVTLQVVPEAESHPLHPVKVDPPMGAAVSVTTVPAS